MANLTEKQRKYAQARAKGLSHTAAAAQAGYSSAESAQDLKDHPLVLAAVQKEQERFEKKNDVTREKVFAGLMESIEMAKLQGEPMTMVAGWREIGKMAGYYAPETRRIEISASGHVTIQQLQSMSDAELLKLAEKEVIDGDFTSVPALPEPEKVA